MAIERKTIDITFVSQLNGAKTIEDVLCLATLTAGGILHPESTIFFAKNYFEDNLKGDCENCKMVNVCLAMTINQ